MFSFLYGLLSSFAFLTGFSLYFQTTFLILFLKGLFTSMFSIPFMVFPLLSFPSFLHQMFSILRDFNLPFHFHAYYFLGCFTISVTLSTLHRQLISSSPSTFSKAWSLLLCPISNFVCFFFDTFLKSRTEGFPLINFLSNVVFTFNLHNYYHLPITQDFSNFSELTHIEQFPYYSIEHTIFCL